MKTPAEIKSDAATCLTLPPKAVCNRLELYKDCGGDCRYVIQELYDLVLHLESRLARVERERDAAVEAVEMYPCFTCKNISSTYCKDCLRNRSLVLDRAGEFLPDNYEWRGFCAENTEEKTT